MVEELRRAEKSEEERGGREVASAQWPTERTHGDDTGLARPPASSLPALASRVAGCFAWLASRHRACRRTNIGATRPAHSMWLLQLTLLLLVLLLRSLLLGSH